MAVVVHPALFWCAWSWDLTQVQLARLRATQLRMIRKMVGSRRLDEENLCEYTIRSARTVKNLMRKHCVQQWDADYHRLQFSWGGQLARMATKCSERLTYQVLKHRDIAWIHTTSEQFGGNQQHGRKLHTWRWERCFMKYSPSWQQDALDQSKWLSSLDEMVVWRCAHR